MASKTKTFARLSHSATPDVTIDIAGDGREFPLRYSIGTVRKLKEMFGESMMGLKASLLTLDEARLPEMIIEGLRDPKSGELPEGISLELLLEQPAGSYTYFLQKFSEAWSAGQVEKKTDTDSTPESQ